MDIEITHRELTDAVEWPKRRVFYTLHTETLWRIREVRARCIEDGIIITTAQLDRDFTRDERANPIHQWLTQHQRLWVKPATFVEQAAQAAAHLTIIFDGVFIVNGRNETLVCDVQQCKTWRLINTATLCFNDSVFNLVTHAKAVTATNNVRFVDKIGLCVELLAIQRNWPAFFKSHNNVFFFDLNVFVVVRNAHDRRDNVHAGR